MIRILAYAALSGALMVSVNAAAEDDTTRQYLDTLASLGYPAPKENELVHIPPTLEDLENADLHPELKRVIRRGLDLFTNTQQLRGEHVFNNMNCSSCHLGEGRMPFSAPIWAAAVTLPDYRGKNAHVNNLEERIAGCFTYSMNDRPSRQADRGLGAPTQPKEQRPPAVQHALDVGLAVHLGKGLSERPGQLDDGVAGFARKQRAGRFSQKYRFSGLSSEIPAEIPEKSIISSKFRHGDPIPIGRTKPRLFRIFRLN